MRITTAIALTLLSTTCNAQTVSPDPDGFASRWQGHTICPDPGVKCKVVILNEQEERALTAPNGVLDTAAQGKQLELGGIVVYLKQKLANAPQGEVKPLPASEKKDPPPVDKK